MKHFRALIITKNKIKLTALIVSTITAVGISLKYTSSEPEAVPAFSGANATDIIKEGVPHEDESFDFKKAITGVLGFDTDKPETIVESSSVIFKEADTSTAVEDDAPAPENTEAAEAATAPPDDTLSLPEHDEIITAKGLKINNATNYNIDLDSLCTEPLDINLTKTEPEVLIVHTHTTECYAGDEMSGESERTTNEAYNMSAIGDIISKTLESYGIQTVHDKTIHDYPSYQGAYTRALETINKNMEQYPSIKVVLDIHRDAYVYSDGSKLKVTAEIDGKDTAQVMLVLGTDSMGLQHPYWQSNLALGAKIQNTAEIMYPGIMRPLNLRRERFNMHVTKGSLLLEIGSNGNSLAEAKNAAECIGRAIAAVLLNG